MDVYVEPGEPATVHISGQVDLSNVKEVDAGLQRAIDQSQGGIIVNLSNVQYIDSAGIQAIFSAYQRILRSGGMIALVITTRPIKSIFDLLRLEHLPGIAITDSPEEAGRMIRKRNEPAA